MLSAKCYGQYQNPPVNFPSHNAAGLGLYGEIPISFYTGVPDISVAIYTINEGGIQVPISLSYHASGLRPDVHPGWVGNNWSLLAGGVITRKINGGFPDEFSGASSSIYYQTGYYYNHQVLSSTDWYSTSNLEAAAAVSTALDIGADEFSFNFLNYSGKFYMDDLGNWLVSSNKKIKVVIGPTPFLSIPIDPPHLSDDAGALVWKADNPYPQSFGSFTLITEDGTQYIFGNNTNAIEYSINLFGQQSDYWKANSWYLTKIISPDGGHQVTFNYSADRFSDPLTNVFTCSLYEALTLSQASVTGNAPSLLNLKNTCSLNSTLVPNVGRYGGELIAPIYLESIETPTQKTSFNRSVTTELRYRDRIFSNILFTPVSSDGSNICHFKNVYALPYQQTAIERNSDDICSELGPYGWDPNDLFTNHYFGDALATATGKFQWYKLDMIEVFDKLTSTSVKQFNLTYNNNATERLKLLSFQEQSLDPNVSSSPPYQFGYNALTYNGVVPAGEPFYLVSLTDHWGFYNPSVAPAYIPGGGAVGTFLGGTYYAAKNTGVSTGVVVDQAQGILNSITYPTGGKTEFIYENNTYAKKVKKIRNISNDPTQSITVMASDQLAGGIRIKSIKSYDPQNSLNPIIKNYYYRKNYAPSVTDITSLPGSGLLASDVQYSWNNFTYTSSDLTYSSNLFSLTSVLPASQNSAGNPIGYSQVVEKLGDGSYTIYKYSNFDTLYIGNSVTDPGHLDDLYLNTLTQTTSTEGSYYDNYSYKDLERGRMLVKTTYNAFGNRLTKNVSHYAKLSDDYIRMANVRSLTTCANQLLAYMGTAYKHYAYIYELDHEDSYVFNQSTPATSFLSSKDITYTGLGLPFEITTSQSDGKSLTDHFLYPSDLTTTDVSSCTTTYNCTGVYGPACYDGCMTQYPTDRPAYTACINQCNTSYQNCVTNRQTCIDNLNAGNPYYKMVKLNMIAPVIEKKTLINDGGAKSLLSANLTGYKEFATGRIYPEKIFTFSTTSPLPVSTIIPTTYITSLAYDSRYQLRLTYDSYDAIGNLRQYTKKNGNPITYLWGYSATFPVAEIVNADWPTVSAKLGEIPLTEAQVNAMSIAATVQSTMAQLRTKLPAARISGYTYHTIYGITTSTDANGQIHYSDVDVLGRLFQTRNFLGEIEKTYKYTFR